MYAVVDIETTGGTPKDSRITEIAIVITDGEKVIDEYQTLVNPERPIDFYVTKLTGINDRMVANAPKFHEIAKHIIEKTEGNIFVAHNANFDYSHIKRAFSDLGYDYKRETVCTVQLSRKIFPNEGSYSLGKLSKSLGIKLSGAHRAMNDTLATTDLLHLLIKNDNGTLQAQKNTNILHDRLSVEDLPNKTGIYYFLNSEKEIIYIGKSKNIRQRVKTHLANYLTNKGQKIIESISEVDSEVLGSELIALLKESDEIKKHSPVHNRALKKKTNPWGIYAYQTQDNYYRLAIAKYNFPNGTYIQGFTSKVAAQKTLFELNDKYGLCQVLNGLYKPKPGQPCFHYTIKKCDGACIKEEDFTVYNEKVQKLIDEQELPTKSFYILEHGRTKHEKACIKVENGKYIGYGFYDSNFRYNTLNDLDAFIQPYADNKDVKNIIKAYLKQGKNNKIIPFNS